MKSSEILDRLPKPALPAQRTKFSMLLKDEVAITTKPPTISEAHILFNQVKVAESRKLAALKLKDKPDQVLEEPLLSPRRLERPKRTRMISDKVTKNASTQTEATEQISPARSWPALGE